MVEEVGALGDEVNPYRGIERLHAGERGSGDRRIVLTERERRTFERLHRNVVGRLLAAYGAG